MVFPQYNYQNFHNNNKELWPLQPATTENWCKMVNDCFAYCENIENPYEFEGICSASDLPSEHPYWDIQVLNKQIEYALQISNKLERCKKNPDMFKYEFSQNTDFQAEEKKFNELKENINKNKYLKYTNKQIIK
jgi:hypothetical protein